MEHPPEEVLLRFVLGATSGEENHQVVRHLLARCPSCAAALRKMLAEPPLDPPLAPEAYDAALDRVAARLRKLTSPQTPAPRGPVRASLLSFPAPRLHGGCVGPTIDPTIEVDEADHQPDSATSGNDIPRRGSG